MTATTFSGAMSGNASTATLASTITVTNSTTNANYDVPFTDGSSALLEDDGAFHNNPSTGVLTSTTFTGALSGNASTVTTNANLTGDVTSVGNAAVIAAGVIVDADINASAAITATKIADGSVTSAEFQYIGGLTSDAQTQLDAKAPLVSPTFTGTPIAPTASVGTDDTQIATTAYVIAEIAARAHSHLPETPPTPTSSSDRRFKKNISTVSGALEKLSKLNPVNYDWRQDEFQNKGFNDKKQWGFVAQEVEEVMPELVGADEDDYLTLNYNGFVPLLTKAMQEQQDEIENQQKEIDELKAQLEMIMKMMQSDMSDKTDNKKAENNQKPVKLSMATVK